MMQGSQFCFLNCFRFSKQCFPRMFYLSNENILWLKYCPWCPGVLLSIHTSVFLLLCRWRWKIAWWALRRPNGMCTKPSSTSSWSSFWVPNWPTWTPASGPWSSVNGVSRRLPTSSLLTHPTRRVQSVSMSERIAYQLPQGRSSQAEESGVCQCLNEEHTNFLKADYPHQDSPGCISVWMDSIPTSSKDWSSQPGQSSVRQCSNK